MDFLRWGATLKINPKIQILTKTHFFNFLYEIFNTGPYPLYLIFYCDFFVFTKSSPFIDSSKYLVNHIINCLVYESLPHQAFCPSNRWIYSVNDQYSGFFLFPLSSLRVARDILFPGIHIGRVTHKRKSIILIIYFLKYFSILRGKNHNCSSKMLTEWTTLTILPGFLLAQIISNKI